MKPRHAAALALVGWYLMMPPWNPALDANAPLSKWAPPRYIGYDLRLTEQFKDLAGCQAALSELKHFVERRPKDFAHHGPFHPAEAELAVMLDRALCIAEN